jgi:hypothetical protein
VTLNQPLESFVDLIGRKPPLQFASEFAKAVSALGYCCRKRAVKLTVEKKLPGL